MCPFQSGQLIQRKNCAEHILIGLNPDFANSNQRDWDGKPSSLKHGNVFLGSLLLARRLAGLQWPAITISKQLSHPLAELGLLLAIQGSTQLAALFACLHLLGFVGWIIHMVAIVKWSGPEKLIFLQDPTWCGSKLLYTTPELAAAAF